MVEAIASVCIRAQAYQLTKRTTDQSAERTLDDGDVRYLCSFLSIPWAQMGAYLRHYVISDIQSF